MNANEVPEKIAELRDVFAAAALQGLVASNFYDRYKAYYRGEELVGSRPRVAAGIAYEYADELLARREVRKP